MLALLRRGLNTWPARLFFLLLVASFVVWGVADAIRNIGAGDENVAATVADQPVSMTALQDAYRRQIGQVTQMLGGRTEPTPQIRRGVAQQALDRLITQAALSAKVTAMGIAVPDDVLREEVFSVPALRDGQGNFDRNRFNQMLANNGLTEGRFLALLRAELAQRQLLEGVRVGTAVPDILTKEVFAFQNERRVADVIDLPFAAARDPESPTEAQLKRWYDNHIDLYSTPELRRIKAVVLTPDRLAQDVEVTDRDLQGAYEQRRSEFNIPEKRTVDVILARDEAAAKALAEKWRGGADWAAMQEAAKADGAVPVELTNATRSEIPAPELAEAVFAAAADQVPDPVHSALGWHVLRVARVTPGTSRSLDDVREELRQRIAADKAADLVYDRANKIEDLLASGSTLDEMPADLGLAGVSGTLDANGKTAAGEPAPIPGSAELRQQLVQAAFAAKPEDQLRLVQVTDPATHAVSYFALKVEDIIKPTPKPFEEVQEQVRADWTRDAIRHSQEEAAAKLLAAVKGGQSLADAATIAGLRVDRLPAVGRASPADGVPPQLITPLFSLKPGEATMIETPDGFVVAVLAAVEEPQAAQDALGYGQVRDALIRATGDDIERTYANAVRTGAKVTVTPGVIDRVAEP